ncbi:hypothetical protein DSUL_160106 [Desulfovibrionales bacterium]
MLANEQQRHQKKCGPYCLSLEIFENRLELELLVRARQRLRCSCIAYATSAQREHCIDWLDTILRELDITV